MNVLRELKAIQLALESYACPFMGKSLLWHTDNQNCVKLVQRGSTKITSPKLSAVFFFQSVLKNVFHLILYGFLEVQIQKQITFPIWLIMKTSKLLKIFFHFVDQVWGPHTIDRFASVSNTKLSRFNSLFWYPESEAVDAFTQSWRFENKWLVPPIKLVYRTINHIVVRRGNGTLIVPKWLSGDFWTLLFGKNMEYRRYVVDVLEFTPYQNDFKHGSNSKSLFGSDRFNSRVLAVRLCAD